MLVYKTATEESMLRATSETKPINDFIEMKEVRISIDGSWQKRGHSSLNGVMV